MANGGGVSVGRFLYEHNLLLLVHWISNPSSLKTKTKVTKVSLGNVLKILCSPVSEIAFSSLLCVWLSILYTQSCGYLCLHSKSTEFPMAPFTQMNFQPVPTRMERRI